MKKTNSNNWDMVYKKCNHNRYSKFNGVKNPVELKSNFANLLKNCYIAIIAFLIIALVLLIYTFKSNPMIIVYCLIFLAGLFVYAVYNSTYNLKIDSDKLTLSANFQKNVIKTNIISNIYLSRRKSYIIFFPIYTYSINIIYDSNDNQLLLALPVIMLEKKQLLKFFNNIDIIKNISNFNEFNDIIRKIEIINDFQKKSSYNVNKELFINNFIITFSGGNL